MKLHLAEISRRGVFRTLVAYGVASWIAIEATSIIAPAFLLPAWTVAAVTTIVVLGAFPAIFFAWRYEITREGVKRDTRHVPDDIDRIARRLGIVLAIALLAITTTLWINYFRTQEVVAVDSMAKAQLGAPEIEEDGKIRSIAVLPFNDFSPDSGRPFLADGIAESILHALAQNSELVVTARTSSFYFRDKDVTAAEIGRILGVQVLLEGSIQVVEDRIRVTSQLVRTSDQSHLWSNVYEDSLDNLFHVQDTIAHAVRDLVLVTKDSSTASAAPNQNFPSVEAFELLQEAKVALYGDSLESIDKAIRLLRVAIDLSPEYADAHATLSQALESKWYLLQTEYSKTGVEVHDIYEQMDAATQRALEIDPDHALALLQEGMQSQMSGGQGFSQAEQRVAELAPNTPDVLWWLAGLAEQNLEYARSRVFLDRARAVDPSNFEVFVAYMGRQCGLQTLTTVLEAQLKTYSVSVKDAMSARAKAHWCDGRYTESIRLKSKIYKVASEPGDAFSLLNELAMLDHEPALEFVNDMHLLLPNMYMVKTYDNTVFFDSIARERAKVYRWSAESTFSYWWFMPINYGLALIQTGDLEAAWHIIESVRRNWEDYFSFMESRPIQKQTLTIYAYQAWLMAQRGQVEQSKALSAELLEAVNSKQLGLFTDTMGELRDIPLLVMLLNGEDQRAVQWLSDAEQYRWNSFQIVLTSPIYAQFREHSEVQEILTRLVSWREAALASMKDAEIPEVLDPSILVKALKSEITPSLHHLAQIELHYRDDIPAAARLYEKALAQEPNNPAILADAARLANMLGRAEDAVSIWQKMRDKGNGDQSSSFRLAIAYFYAGRWQDCINALKPLTESDPAFDSAYRWTGTAYAMLGNPEVGLEYIRQEENNNQRLAGIAVASFALGRRDEALDALNSLAASDGDFSHYRLAYLSAYLGENDRAFDFLDLAFGYGDPNLAYIRVNPLFSNIHDDKRWIPFLEKMGIAPAQLEEVEFNPLDQV